jgi:ribonuclease D
MSGSLPLEADPAELIDTEAALLNALPRLAAGGPWALDTEFMRVDTYYPRLCLLQIATPALAVCIDPLAVRDLSPLDEALRDPTFPKLMHAAKQDLEALSVHGNHRVSPVRDTQIAASLLGLPEQVGYAWLVEHFHGIVLDKSQTRTDWAQRPLTDAQRRYATQDVVHLLSLWQVLEASLRAEGKWDWFEEECGQLKVEEAGPPWLRLKGLAQCEGSALSVAQRLCVWREDQARTLNRPRTWILRDETLIALARAFLYKPRWVWEAAAALHGKVQASPQYWRCMPREAQGIFDAVQMGQR